MTTFQAVIAKWGTITALAADLDVPYERARQWHYRDSIPSGYWPALIVAASKRGIAITYEQLAHIAARTEAA